MFPHVETLTSTVSPEPLWKRVAIRIGEFQGRLMIVLFYFIVLTPFALVVRWLTDPLAIKAGALRQWCIRDEEGDVVERATRQY